MKYCAQCGGPINDGDTACVNCGCAVAPAVAPQYIQVVNRPAYQLSTSRGLLKYILLSIITFGIYPLVIMSSISTDINTIAGRYDGKRTMHYLLIAFIFSWMTLGIAPIVWYHNISARIGNELRRRGVSYSFGAGSFWGWNVLGSLIIIGPLVYLHKLFEAMNLISRCYNELG